MQKSNKKVTREIIASVVSDKMDKTVVVKVGRQTTHPIFKKTIRLFSKFKVHDEKNSAKKGDVVKIKETRPVSRDKRWVLVDIVEKAK